MKINKLCVRLLHGDDWMTTDNITNEQLIATIKKKKG